MVRWTNLQNQATRPDIAPLIDDAILAAVEGKGSAVATRPATNFRSHGFPQVFRPT